jgi:hypothetical protein
VALEAAFADLTRQLTGLQEVFDSLALTTGTDRSKGAVPLLVDNLHDLVVKFQGELKKLRAEASRAENAASPTLNLVHVRRHLSSSQSTFHDLLESMCQELLAYDCLLELDELGRGSGTQWRKWTDAAQSGLEPLPLQLQIVLRCYFRCWQEIAERAGANSVSVEATGQRIVVGSDALKQVETREVT